MVLMAIVGELGGGKTISLSYLCWNNYYYKNRKIFANFNLYGIPYTPVKSVEDMNSMIPLATPKLKELLAQEEIFFGGDELWRWVDARCALMGLSQAKTKRVSNKIITDILLASRKAFVTIAYTTQSFGQIDKRIRNITDFVCYPAISFDGQVTTMAVFRGNRPVATSVVDNVKFYNEPMFAIYNTYERIQELELEGKKNKEVFHDIIENPAWHKYLIDQGYNEERIAKETEKIAKLITKPKETPKEPAQP